MTAAGSGRSDIFTDLETGNSYGSFTVAPSDVGTVISVTLNDLAVAALDAALGSTFAVGLHLDTMDAVSEWDGVRFSALGEDRIRRVNLKIGVADSLNLTLGHGNPVPELGAPHETIVKGDRTCLSIAAASVIAKCLRDRLMDRLAKRHPQFSWDTNKGYGTAAHLNALDEFGPTEHHRKTFSPVAQGRLL